MIDTTLFKSIISFKKRQYRHLNSIKIDKTNLIRNYNTLQKMHPHYHIAPVLKSNAYGHGLKITASIFDSLDAPFLVVDSMYEAYELYKHGVKTPILIIGYTNLDNFEFKKLPFEYAVSDLKITHTLNKHQQGSKIHIFVDTGLHREGVLLDDLSKFIEEVQKLENITINGICSHFANANDKKSRDFQLTQFKKAVSIIENTGVSPQWKHISASDGIFAVKDPLFNLIRAGIALYGIHDAITSLKPALSFTSTLIQIKKLKKGQTVGYEGNYKAQKSITVGLIPAGYYEGIDRRLSNKGSILIHGVECPIIGNVSMNLASVDISKVKNPQVGDDCIIFSNNSNDKNSIVNSAKRAEMIPYELLVHLAESVRREII